MLLEQNFGKLDSLKCHILHPLDRTLLIYACILLSFSQSLVIHDSRAEVQRFMIPKFLKQRFMILTCLEVRLMIHDFTSTPDTYLKDRFTEFLFHSFCMIAILI